MNKISKFFLLFLFLFLTSNLSAINWGKIYGLCMKTCTEEILPAFIEVGGEIISETLAKTTLGQIEQLSKTNYDEFLELYKCCKKEKNNLSCDAYALFNAYKFVKKDGTIKPWVKELILASFFIGNGDIDITSYKEIKKHVKNVPVRSALIIKRNQIDLGDYIYYDNDDFIGSK